MGGYGAQDGGEAEVLGEWNLLPVAVGDNAYHLQYVEVIGRDCSQEFQHHQNLLVVVVGDKSNHLQYVEVTGQDCSQ